MSVKARQGGIGACDDYRPRRRPGMDGGQAQFRPFLHFLREDQKSALFPRRDSRCRIDLRRAQIEPCLLGA